MVNENEGEALEDVVEETEYVEETPTEESTEETEATDWKAKYEETQGRLKRAETKLSKAGETKSEKSPSKSDDLGYAEKAYLATQGIKGGKEFDFVKDELKKSGAKDLDSLLENPYFKAQLEIFRTSEAVPTGKRSSGVATESVEYWATKPIEDVPMDMRAKVVNFKLEKETKKGVFYNS